LKALKNVFNKSDKRLYKRVIYKLLKD